MAKGKKPTAQDAQLIMQLYDLRREPVMRTARKFMVSEFWPATYDDFKVVLAGFGTEHNAYFRQVLSYWDMAAAMVLSGAIHEELFFQSNGEPYLLWAKYGEYVPQARSDFGNPELWRHLEKLVTKPQGQRRVKALQARVAARRAQVAAAKAAK